jgi:hypothetical protein
MLLLRMIIDSRPRHRLHRCWRTSGAFVERYPIPWRRAAFQICRSSEAKTFDNTKVASIEFEPESKGSESATPNPGRPISATWSQKDGSSGKTSYKYINGASGRHGLLSTKHLKNRTYNQGLKNIALWSYWKGAGSYGTGTHKQGLPYFEALKGKRHRRNVQAFSLVH